MRRVTAYAILITIGSCSHVEKDQQSSEPFFEENQQTFEASNALATPDEELLADLDIDTNTTTNQLEQPYSENAFNSADSLAVKPVLRDDEYGLSLPPEGRIHWLGYQLNDVEKKLRIEIKYSGEPKYVLSQEYNSKQQPELIISFLNTSIKKGLRKDLVAEEFIAPVGYVRNRSKRIAGNIKVTDIVLTLRAAEKPMLYADQNRIVLEYALSSDSQDYLRMLKDIGTAELISANITPEMIVGRTPVDDLNTIALPKTRPQSVDPNHLPNYSEKSLYESIPREKTSELNAMDQRILRATESKPIIENSAIYYNNPASELSQFNNTLDSNFNTPTDALNQVLNIEPIEEVSSPVPVSNFNQSFNNSQPINSNNQNNIVIDNPNAGLELFENQIESSSTSFNNTELPVIDTSSLPVPVAPPAEVQPQPSIILQQPTQPQPVEQPNSLEYNNTPIQQNNRPDDFEIEDEELDFEEEMFEVRGKIGWLHVAQANSDDLSNDTFINSVNSTNFSNSNQGSIDISTDMVGSESMGSEQQYTKKMMDLDFRGAPLIEVVRAISQESNVNFTFPPGIGTTPIFVDFKNVSWDLALKAVLESSGLGMVEIAPNLVRIDNIARLAAQGAQLERARLTAERLIPTKVLVFRLSYSTAAAVAGTIRSMLGAGASSNLRVEVDTRTNSLIVEAIPSQLEKVKVLIDRLDLQTPQVEISSKIVEIQSTNGDSFGVRWGGGLNVDPSNGLGFGGLTFPNSVRSTYAVDPGGLGASPGNLNLRFGSLNSNISLEATLALNETRKQTKLLQSNRIVVQDNTAGTITGGTTDFFIVPGGGDGGPENISISNNLTISVTPHISANGSVQMDVNISTAFPTGVAAGAQSSSTTRSVNTKLLKQSGETAVIGGMFDSNTNRTEEGIPILSWLPIIGPLFRQTTNNSDQKELLILITPKVLNTVGASGGSRFRASSGASGLASNIAASDNAMGVTEITNEDNSQYFNDSNLVNNTNSFDNNSNNSQNANNYVDFENSNQGENFNNSGNAYFDDAANSQENSQNFYNSNSQGNFINNNSENSEQYNNTSNGEINNNAEGNSFSNFQEDEVNEDF